MTADNPVREGAASMTNLLPITSLRGVNSRVEGHNLQTTVKTIITLLSCGIQFQMCPVPLRSGVFV